MSRLVCIHESKQHTLDTRYRHAWEAGTQIAASVRDFYGEESITHQVIDICAERHSTIHPNSSIAKALLFIIL